MALARGVTSNATTTPPTASNARGWRRCDECAGFVTTCLELSVVGSQVHVQLSEQPQARVLARDRVDPRLHVRQEEPVDAQPAAEARLAGAAPAREIEPERARDILFLVVPDIENFAGTHEVQPLNRLVIELQKPDIAELAATRVDGIGFEHRDQRFGQSHPSERAVNAARSG